VAGAVVERLSVHARDHSFYVELPIWNSLDAPGRLTHVCREKVVRDISGLDVCTLRAPESARTAEMYGFYDEDLAFFERVRRRQTEYAGLMGARQSVALTQCLRDRSPHFEN
jgi:hypothetical protein